MSNAWEFQLRGGGRTDVGHCFRGAGRCLTGCFLSGPAERRAIMVENPSGVEMFTSWHQEAERGGSVALDKM